MKNFLKWRAEACYSTDSFETGVNIYLLAGLVWSIIRCRGVYRQFPKFFQPKISVTV